MNFKAAIFDLDGTIMDSMGVWEKIDYDFLGKRNIPIPETYPKDVSVLGFREAAEYTIELFHLEETVEELMKEWNDMATYEYGYNVKLKPYVKEYLTLLKNKGVKLGTATSLSETLSEPFLRNNGIYGLFDEQCRTDEVKRGKRFPDVYLKAASKLKTKPNECIVFEDILEGVLSAKEAGMLVFGVYDEFSKEYEQEIRRIADGYLYHFKHAPFPKSCL